MTSPSAAPISALNIPSVTSRPSLSCLQWSADGQVFFLTKGSIYILTPDRGVHSVTQGDVHDSHVKWFSTMIDFNPRDVHNWPAGSQDWAGLSLGSLDVGLRAMSCSPSNLTGNGGHVCIAAILSSNMDLSLWHTPKNTIKGEWVKLCDVTPFIAELASREPHCAAEQTLRSQITGLLWSTQAEFDITPAPCLDGSLLVTGTRAGTLMLFRFENSALEHVTTVEVADQWITHLALSPWTSQGGECETTLACGAADGSVSLVKIVQILTSESSPAGFSRGYTIRTRVEKLNLAIFQPDNTGITALRWISPTGNMVLVRATPGVISLWSGGSTTLNWSGTRFLRLCTQKLSVGSSSLHPVSGLHYVRQEDALLVSLFDGTVHVIHSLIEEPTLSDVSHDLTSKRLSDILRSNFTRTERQDISKRDVNRVSGLIPYDDFSVALWVQESAQPSNFDYKYDVLHESTFVAARLCKPPTHDAFLHELSTILNSTKASCGTTPLHLLRPIFLQLQDLLDLQPRVLETLLQNADIWPSSPVLTPWPGEDGPALRTTFRQSLKQHMFGCNVLLSLRLRLSVADFCWRHTTNLSKRDAYSVVAQRFLRSISFIILRILCRHLFAVVACLKAEDIPFLMRIALQSSMPSAPSDLRADAEALLNTLSSHIPSCSTDTYGKESMQENCPACGLVIYLDGDSEATCPKGHTWGRCSVTSFILSTPLLRTCAGCNRKAFLPLSCRDPASTPNWLPSSAQSWVVKEFLECASRCLFCGNNFGSFF
ncbi:transcription factor IIIC subunit delta N-term-domain-containing protein [Mycena maculata]|uniref:Transcription factor IIIC subunit delta N-term-domain-containing protein n=1 Tax=Mycena maculata TaxID=230809 RepID=A0AAD7KAA8_9AGAR|nr:transcription factor IIIC subunit delta N-term-domain-containing protein [Mycena maculata]